MVKDLLVDGSYEIRYYYDEELVNYKPYESLSGLNITTQVPVIPEPGESGSGPTEPVQADIDPVDLSIARDFFYVLKNVSPGIRHTWQVKILSHGIDSIVIEPSNAHITLEGQRMYGSEYFDGYIDITEDIRLFNIGGLGLVDFSDEPAVDLYNAEFIQITENINLLQIGVVVPITIEEGTGALAPRVYFESSLFLATEDDEILCTEDDIRIGLE